MKSLQKLIAIIYLCSSSQAIACQAMYVCENGDKAKAVFMVQGDQIIAGQISTSLQSKKPILYYSEHVSYSPDGTAHVKRRGIELLAAKDYSFLKVKEQGKIHRLDCKKDETHID